MIKVGIVLNQTRKLSFAAQTALDLIDGSELLEVNLIKTEYSGHAIEISKELSPEVDVIIAVGGDGTAHEVLNGIMQSNSRPTFGIIPSGTGNDFLRSIREFNPGRFLNSIENKHSRKIDIGAFSSTHKTDYFLNIADLGFGAKVVSLMNRQRDKGIRGKVSYSLAIVRTFFTYRKTPVKIEFDETIYDGKVLMVVFCNGSTFGHGLTINPDASTDSGQLEITVIGDVSLFEYVKNLSKLKRGEKINHPEIFYYSAKKLNVQNENKLEVEADGELYKEGLQSVEILPKAISLIN